MTDDRMPLSRRAFLPSSVLASSLFLLAAGAAPSTHRPRAAQPIARLGVPGWMALHQSFLDKPDRKTAELLLVGDSITQDLLRAGPLPQQDMRPVWNRFYAPRKALNIGISGDTTANLLWRLRNGEIDGITPKVAQLLIGANNFGYAHWNAADTLAGIEANIDELRRRLPRTKIILLSVLPSRRSKWADLNTLAVNRSLAARYRPGNAVHYIDVTAAFHRNGALDPDAFYDGALQPPAPLLHPSQAGWTRMAEMVEPTLAALMAR